MKSFKHLLLIALAAVISSLTAIAQSPLPDSSIIIIEPKEDIKPSKPKMPSRQQISCLYYDGTLIIDFTISEGQCELSVTNLSTGLTRQHSFDSTDEASVYVGPLTQAYIEISTESGHSYVGWLGIIP